MSRQITMKISGMHCKGCALGLQGALETLPQVAEAKVTYPQQVATVMWDGEETYEPALRAAVQKAGFEVEAFK